MWLAWLFLREGKKGRWYQSVFIFGKHLRSECTLWYLPSVPGRAINLWMQWLSNRDWSAEYSNLLEWVSPNIDGHDRFPLPREVSLSWTFNRNYKLFPVTTMKARELWTCFPQPTITDPSPLSVWWPSRQARLQTLQLTFSDWDCLKTI